VTGNLYIMNDGTDPEAAAKPAKTDNVCLPVRIADDTVWNRSLPTKVIATTTPE